VPPNPVEMLDSKRFKQLLSDLQAQYDLLVFDSPPVLNLVDSLVVGKQVDGLVLVVRSFVTNKFAAQQVAKQIAASKVKALGVVLNNVDIPSNAYYQYSSYGQYGDYYTGEGQPAPSPSTGFVSRLRTRLQGAWKRRS